MRFVLALILLGLAAFNGAAEETTFEFKGIALGSDISSIESTGRFSCKDPQRSIADRVCSLKFSERETIAGIPVEALFLSYYSGKLETIFISFDSKNFSTVTDALTAKYGEGAIEIEMVKNQMGAKFENRIYSWIRRNATLEARRYASKLDRSSVMYSTDFALQEFERRRGTSAKEKAKDL